MTTRNHLPTGRGSSGYPGPGSGSTAARGRHRSGRQRCGASRPCERPVPPAPRRTTAVRRGRCRSPPRPGEERSCGCSRASCTAKERRAPCDLPGVGGEYQVAQRLDERTLVVDPVAKARAGKSAPVNRAPRNVSGSWCSSAIAPSSQIVGPGRFWIGVVSPAISHAGSAACSARHRPRAPRLSSAEASDHQKCPRRPRQHERGAICATRQVCKG